MGKLRHDIILFAAALLTVFAATVYAVPPKVIKTVPENGDQNVDPSIKQIKIEFDQDMSRNGFSICGGGPNFPDMIDKPVWADKRTLTAAVKLKPNHKYEMSINCPSYQNCKNIGGEPAEIYPIKFKTASSSKTSNTQTKSPSVLLQQARYAEETQGDLDKAIEIYQQVIEEAVHAEKLAAQATYQIGICFLKKGEKENAAQYFQEVIDDYPEQKAIVDNATQQLDKMGVTKTAQYTQEMHNEIDSNGLIHFKSPNRISNNNSEPITTTGFINSDFVMLTKIYEENGTAIPFEATHEGSVYRYKITFNKPIMSGEKMTYYAEGTIKGLIKPVSGEEGVFRYFMVHSPAADQPVLRIETYLLPKDAVFISTSTPDIQKTEKDGRIELRVEKVVPANGSITTEFQYQLPSANIDVSPKQLEKIVNKAVLTISTCAENDPKVAMSLNTLKGLDQNKVVSELVKYLDDNEATVRRSAIFILWRGGFDSIKPAEEKLLQLCTHEENFTRGMAAITLGGLKVVSSFETLKNMASTDKDGYARRCAAYALGLFGDKQALPVLQKTLKEDTDPIVKNNAQAAIKMLTKLNDPNK
jgi:hypothetical protein